MNPEWPTSLKIAGWALAALMGVALLALIAHTTLGFGSPSLDFAIQDGAYDFVTLAGALVVLGVAIARREGRLAWGLIGTGLLCWAAADIYFSISFHSEYSPPFPSAADASYLAGYLFMLAGLITLVRMRVRRMTAVVWTDVAIGALCVAAIGTALVLDFVIKSATGSALEVGVAVSYPLLDLAILAVAAAAVALTGWRPGRAVALVTAGMALTGIGDAVYTHQSLSGTYDSQAWNNSLWPLGVSLIALGSVQPPPRRTVRGLPEGWGAVASPAIFALAVIALLMLESQGTDTPVVTILTIATLAAIVLRLAITFAENHHLLDALQRDGLTGLANRGRLYIDLPRILEEGDESTVGILDLDGFKAYNDSFGHGAGDSLLIRLGSRLDAAMQGRGKAYRLGGDEFAVIADGTGKSAAATIAAATEALSEHGDGFLVGASCGSVEVPHEATDPIGAMELADMRMYEQKDSRRPTPGAEVQAVLLRLLGDRAPGLGAHGNSVAALAAAVGKRMGLDGSAVLALRRAAELHDIGKIAIPDAILDKQGPLDEAEWEFMRQHTLMGERILSAATSLGPIGRVVRASHERWDGDGYPDGLVGDEIPLASRIIFVCDAFDAMTKERPYADSRSREEAIAELRKNAGSQFDPDVVAAACEVLEKPPVAEEDRSRQFA